MDELAGYVAQHDAVIVDVRLVPVSSKRELRMEALARRFGDRYLWVREWALAADKSRILDLAEGAKRVSSVWLQRRVPLLVCECKTLAECHRLTLATAAQEQLGVVVKHLGQTERDAQQEALWT